MPSSDRDTAGETFNNTYNNGTLVGNWLEDRLQRSSHHQKPIPNDGLLEDPRITRCRNAPQVRQDLMYTTYDVDYSRKGGLHGHAGSPTTVATTTLSTATTAAERQSGDTSAHEFVQEQQFQQSVLQPTTGGGSLRGVMSAGGKDGVHRALLFSKDPVADPQAQLPASTNTDTYGAFFLREGAAAEGGEAVATEGPEGTTLERSEANNRNNHNKNTSARQRTRSAQRAAPAERDLYESVSNAKTREAAATAAAAAPGGASRVAASFRGGMTSTNGTAAAAVSARRTTTGFASLAEPARSTRGEAGEDESDARWCTSKQAADMPVEHCVFQRRLPPVRM